jgi:outer membrane protein TolC
MRRLWCLALVCTSSFARAEDTPAQVTLASVLAATEHAPAALVPVHEVAAAEANAAAASALPAPVLRGGTTRLTARLLVGLTIPLPVFGTIGAAKRVAAREADVVHAEAGLELRQLRHRVTLAWIELARAGAEVDAQIVVAQQAKDLEAIAAGRQQAGTGADVDTTVATAARARADVELAAAKHAEQAAAAALAGLVGWDPTRPLRADGPFPTGHGVNIGEMRARLVAHPERIVAERRVDAAVATVAQVRKEAWPGLALEGEIAYDDRSMTEGRTAYARTDATIALAFELPIFAHVGDRTRSAHAKELAERARLTVVEHDLAAGAYAAFQRWQAATEKVTALERDVEPAEAKAARLSAQAYREGARDLSSAIVADRDLAAVRAELNDARASAAVAYAELQLAIGGDVAP